MKRQHKAALAILLVLAVGCATVGPGADPVVVKAEDVLTNSLTTYSAAMNWHFANSTKESPALYHAFEDFRVKFPVAWQALDSAKRQYQIKKANGTASLDAALTALSGLVSAVTPLIGKL
jgi:hypothetical protein